MPASYVDHYLMAYAERFALLSLLMTRQFLLCNEDDVNFRR